MRKYKVSFVFLNFTLSLNTFNKCWSFGKVFVYVIYQKYHVWGGFSDFGRVTHDNRVVGKKSQSTDETENPFLLIDGVNKKQIETT